MLFRSKHKRLARYFIILTVPLFQIKNFGEFIECQGCYKQFKPDISEYEPQKHGQASPFCDEGDDVSQIHSELLTLWESLYDSLECESILASKRWSVSISGCAECMKRAGASLYVKDYRIARDYLRRILEYIAEWHYINQKFADTKFSSINIERPEFAQKYSQFAQAADVLLKKLP